MTVGLSGFFKRCREPAFTGSTKCTIEGGGGGGGGHTVLFPLFINQSINRVITDSRESQDVIKNEFGLNSIFSSSLFCRKIVTW